MADAYPEWPYYISKLFTGTAETVLNYVAKIDVTYVSGKMESDFGDIRFTKNGNVMALNYYLESYIASTSVVFYVQLGTIKPGENITLRMHYGKSGASTTSDGNSTFIFFDDFNDQSIDSSKWDIEELSGTITEEVAGYIRLAHTGTGNMYIKGKQTFKAGTEIFGRWRFGTSTPIDARRSYLGISNAANEPTTEGVHSAVFRSFEAAGSPLFGGYNRNPVYIDSVVLTGSYNFDTWYKFRIRWYNDKVEYYANGVKVGESTFGIPKNPDISFPESDDLSPFVIAGSSPLARTFNDDIDILFMRNLASLSTNGEPSQGDWSAEDSNPPYTNSHNPAKNAIDVPVSTNVVIHILDTGDGVDQSTIEMTIEGDTVTPDISGTPADYTVTYNPLIDFNYEQVVNVTVDAKDLSGNAMSTDGYIFTTETEASVLQRAYRKAIVLDSTTNDETDLNFKVIVPWVSGKMQSDFSDIQFRDSDGTTLLAQFREVYTDSTSAIWWFKLPFKPAAGKTIYMYYGNSNAALSSDGQATFPLFDDFTGTNGNAPDASKWIISDVTYVYIENNTLHLHIEFLHLDQQCKSIDTFGVGYGFRCSIKRVQTGLGAISTSWHLSEIDKFYHNSSNAASNWYYLTTTNTASALEAATYHTLEIRRIDAFLTRYYYDDSEEWNRNTDNSPGDLGIRWHYEGTNPSGAVNVDWGFTFKLPQNGDEMAEPVFGDEEASTSGKVRCNIRIEPIEELTDHDDTVHERLASEVNKLLRGSIEISDLNLVLSGADNGFENGERYYKEAPVNGGGTFTSISSAKVVHIKNVGRQYSTSSAYGEELNKLLKITTGGKVISTLVIDEPYFASDRNGSIDASSINIETVNLDGTPISSGTGLATEVLVLQ